MVVMAPSDENECRMMLTTAYHHTGPAAVRYPRGSGPGVDTEQALTTLPIGHGELRREGAGGNNSVAILAFGSMVTPALKAAENLNAAVANMRFIKPLDCVLVLALAGKYKLLVSVEENALIGGAGAEVARCLEENGCTTPLLRIGLPDHFIDHGDPALLMAEVGLDAAGIERQIRDRLNREHGPLKVE
jgi:1-deoxy-D-xylulose-5-phosphate synthase